MSDKLAPNIIVVEEDKVINANICNAIERYRFDVIRAYDASSVGRLIEFNKPHVAIISSNIKKSAPMEVVAQLKKMSLPYDLPIVLLLEANEDKSKFPQDNDLQVIMRRPFTPNELMITIRDLLRKSNPVFSDRVISYKDLSIALYTLKVTKGDKTYSFGPAEFKILQLLIQQPNKIFTRRQIIDYVWGVEKEIEDRTIDVHINRIRNILKVRDDINPLIKTIRSAGYCLD